MKAFKFTISGKTAFFKIPEVNTYLYFSYGHIPRVALLGILGSVMGYKGYNDSERKHYPEFYEKLKGVNLSVLPNVNDGIFSRKLQKFNNSTGFASHEAGGNLIVKQVWLEEVSWDVYILLDFDISEQIAENIMNKKAIYIPYLGSNDHIADITNPKYIELEETEGEIIHSLFKDNDFKFKMREKYFKYEEYLPFYLEKDTERHLVEKMIYTNAPIIEKNRRVFTDNVKNMVFYNEE